MCGGCYVWMNEWMGWMCGADGDEAAEATTTTTTRRDDHTPHHTRHAPFWCVPYKPYTQPTNAEKCCTTQAGWRPPCDDGDMRSDVLLRPLNIVISHVHKKGSKHSYIIEKRNPPLNALHIETCRLCVRAWRPAYRGFVVVIFLPLPLVFINIYTYICIFLRYLTTQPASTSCGGRTALRDI